MLHWTFSHTREVWTRGIQVGFTAILGRISCHLPHLATEEVLKALVDVVRPGAAPLEADLTYPEHPIKILDRKARVTSRKTVKLFKVQWSNNSEEEATWEREDFVHSHDPEFELL
jgi:hypothetical protein